MTTLSHASPAGLATLCKSPVLDKKKKKPPLWRLGMQVARWVKGAGGGGGGGRVGVEGECGYKPLIGQAEDRHHTGLSQ